MVFSESEHTRRVELLHELMREEALDVLLFAGNERRGHRGLLRWITDYSISCRHGYALMGRDREPELVLPGNLAMDRGNPHRVPVRFVRHTVAELRDALKEYAPLRRVGIVGLGRAMPVADYLFLRSELSGVEFIDASLPFERVRSVKSEEEWAGVREATQICEACFELLLEVTEPGISERAIGAHMYRRAYECGGDQFLFLTMYGELGADGRCRSTFGPAAERILQPGDQFIFSFELMGALGYFTEFSRMVVLGEPSDVQVRMNRAARAGMDAAQAALHSGNTPADAQRALVAAVTPHRAHSTYWTGHGLGQDLVEEPWIGLEVVEERPAASKWRLQTGTVVTMHPFVEDDRGQGMGYLADSYIVGEDSAERVSTVPLDLHLV